MGNILLYPCFSDVTTEEVDVTKRKRARFNILPVYKNIYNRVVRKKTIFEKASYNKWKIGLVTL